MAREIVNDGSADTEDIILSLKRVIDPELNLDVWNLGLIYKVTVVEGKADIEMTLTSPACPTAQELVAWVESLVYQSKGVTEAKVELVWDPIWDATQMTEEAQLQTGFF